MTPERIRITYALTLEGGQGAEERARDIAREQTVELSEGAYSEDIARRIVGRIEAVEPDGDGAARAVVSYDPAIVGGSIAELFNLVFGNISMKSGIRVVELGLPATLLERFRGPAHGVAGIRERVGAARRPLLCAVAKPVGLSTEELARRCGQLADAGVDVIKDDHSLADQAWAPFAERVAHCQDVVERTNARTGGRTLYLPNVLPGPQTVETQLAIVRQVGCPGVVLSPWIVGFDVVRRIAEAGDLIVFVHPAFSGIGARDHGVSPPVLFGTMCRVAGADAMIYPNAGGRFPISEATCRAIHDRLVAPLGRLAPAFAVLGGGVDAGRVGHWVERYGRDVIFLIGSSLYAQRDLGPAARRVVEALRRDDGA